MKLAITLAAALALAACGGSSKPAPTTPPPAENTVEDEPMSPPSDPEGDPTEMVDDDDDDGDATIREVPPIDQASLDAGGTGAVMCDELVAKTRCMYAKTPDAPPEALKAFNDSVAAWREAVANDATRQAVIDACQMSLDAGHDAFAAMGC